MLYGSYSMGDSKKIIYNAHFTKKSAKQNFSRSNFGGLARNCQKFLLQVFYALLKFVFLLCHVFNLACVHRSRPNGVGISDSGYSN